MSWLPSLVLLTASAPAVSPSQNVAIVGYHAGAFNRETRQEVHLIWRRTFTDADAQRAFRPGMARYAMTSLRCSVAITGQLKDCHWERAPDTPEMRSYYDAIGQGFVLSPEMFSGNRPEALDVFINVETSNSAGVDGPPYPCLPAFCSSTPPPPVPFKRKQ